MSRNIHLLKHAFLVYVRPIVEHNSVIQLATSMPLNQFNVALLNVC